ncbi:MAG: GNAT family N-acetyltransferase [Mycolicibacterium sp.]|uniref:GNAT family N-acetyltransferase n=1 Tax=Mycolicibacterium sp. TaxID=2320850 RepID=UPI003D0DA20B
MGAKLQLSAPTQADLDALPFWYELVGIDPAGRGTDIAEFSRALASGSLGSAVGNPRRAGNLAALMALDSREWYSARMSIRVLRLNSEPIGMLMLGSHWRLWERLDWATAAAQPVESLTPQSAVMNFFIAATATAKLHMVAVRPDQQHRGHGSRLVREAMHIARIDRLRLLYGMFDDSRRPHLGEFYRRGGFTVLVRGEPMKIGLVTGNPADAITPPPAEAYFYTNPSESRPRPHSSRPS